MSVQDKKCDQLRHIPITGSTNPHTSRKGFVWISPLAFFTPLMPSMTGAKTDIVEVMDQIQLFEELDLTYRAYTTDHRARQPLKVSLRGLAIRAELGFAAAAGQMIQCALEVPIKVAMRPTIRPPNFKLEVEYEDSCTGTQLCTGYQNFLRTLNLSTVQ